MEDQEGKAFNRERKDSCYIFYQHSDYAVRINHAPKLTASDLEFEEDIYGWIKTLTGLMLKLTKPACAVPILLEGNGNRKANGTPKIPLRVPFASFAIASFSQKN